MAFPASDTFLQTSGSSQALTTYSGNWSYLEGTFNVPNSAGRVEAASGAWNTARWNADAPNADHRATVEFQWQSSGLYMGPAVRCQSGANTSYHIDSDGSVFYWSKCVAGTQTTLAGPIDMTDMANGDFFRLTVETISGEAHLKAYRAASASPTIFVQQGSTYVDSSSPILTAGYGGIFGYDPSSGWGIGAFEVDNLSGGGGADQPARRRFGGILHTPFKTPNGVRVF